MSTGEAVERAGDQLREEAARRWHDDPLFHARAQLAVNLLRRKRRNLAGYAAQTAREAACIALVLAERTGEQLAVPDRSQDRLPTAPRCNDADAHPDGCWCLPPTLRRAPQEQ